MICVSARALKSVIMNAYAFIISHISMEIKDFKFQPKAAPA